MNRGIVLVVVFAFIVVAVVIIIIIIIASQRSKFFFFSFSYKRFYYLLHKFECSISNYLYRQQVFEYNILKVTLQSSNIMSFSVYLDDPDSVKNSSDTVDCPKNSLISEESMADKSIGVDKVCNNGQSILDIPSSNHTTAQQQHQQKINHQNQHHQHYQQQHHQYKYRQQQQDIALNFIPSKANTSSSSSSVASHFDMPNKGFDSFALPSASNSPATAATLAANNLYSMAFPYIQQKKISPTATNSVIAPNAPCLTDFSGLFHQQFGHIHQSDQIKTTLNCIMNAARSLTAVAEVASTLGTSVLPPIVPNYDLLQTPSAAAMNLAATIIGSSLITNHTPLLCNQSQDNNNLAGQSSTLFNDSSFNKFFSQTNQGLSVDNFLNDKNQLGRHNLANTTNRLLDSMNNIPNESSDSRIPKNFIKLDRQQASDRFSKDTKLNGLNLERNTSGLHLIGSKDLNAFDCSINGQHESENDLSTRLMDTFSSRSSNTFAEQASLKPTDSVKFQMPSGVCENLINSSVTPKKGNLHLVDCKFEQRYFRNVARQIDRSPSNQQQSSTNRTNNHSNVCLQHHHRSHRFMKSFRHSATNRLSRKYSSHSLVATSNISNECQNNSLVSKSTTNQEPKSSSNSSVDIVVDSDSDDIDYSHRLSPTTLCEEKQTNFIASTSANDANLIDDDKKFDQILFGSSKTKIKSMKMSSSSSSSIIVTENTTEDKAIKQRSATSLAKLSKSYNKRSRTFIDPMTEVPRLESWFRENSHPDAAKIERFTSYLNCLPYRSRFPQLEARNLVFW